MRINNKAKTQFNCQLELSLAKSNTISPLFDMNCIGDQLDKFRINKVHFFVLQILTSTDSKM